MESIYYPELDINSNLCRISGDEYKHIKALRLRFGEKIIITNGSGIMATAELHSLDKNTANFINIITIASSNENSYKSALALGILDNKDRMEFALEKATELGINQFYPLNSKFVQKSKFNKDRMISKSISAMKQSKRSFLPSVSEPIDIKSLFRLFQSYDQIILLDESGVTPIFPKKVNSVLMIVGPEGGFSDEEINEIKEAGNVNVWTLGKRRLRAETASIAGLSVINHLLSQE